MCSVLQLQNWSGQPPNLYDISGSAHFVNKCDNGIVIHRNRNPNAGPIDQVQVRYSFVWSPAYAHIGRQWSRHGNPVSHRHMA